MAIYDIENPRQEAENSKSANGGSPKVIHPSAYHAKFLEMAPAKSQSGDAKWIISWELIAAESPEAKKESVGAKRTQHFVVGHKKPEIAKSYQRDFLHILAVCGVDVDALNNDGDLFMAGQKLASEQPVLCFNIEPQTNNPKHLNYYIKGALNASMDKVTDIKGVELDVWGRMGGAETQPEVTKAPSQVDPADEL